jgi:hypothetical protein
MEEWLIQSHPKGKDHRDKKELVEDPEIKNLSVVILLVDCKSKLRIS